MWQGNRIPEAFKTPQDAHKTAQEAPETPHPPPRRPQDDPRCPQDATKTLPRQPKMPPRHAQDALRRPWDASKTHPRAAPDAQNIPRRLKTLPNPPRSTPDLDFGASGLGFGMFFGHILIYFYFGMVSGLFWINFRIS